MKSIDVSVNLFCKRPIHKYTKKINKVFNTCFRFWPKLFEKIISFKLKEMSIVFEI